MDTQLNHKVDILKIVYVEMQRDVKERQDREYRIIITVAGTFLGVAWYILKEGFYIAPLIQIIFCILILSLAEIAIMWLRQSSKRIAGRRETISKIDEAFGFFNSGAYGIGKPIYPDNKKGAPTKPNWTTRLYLMVLFVATFSLCTAILLVKPLNLKEEPPFKIKPYKQVLNQVNVEPITKEITIDQKIISIIYIFTYLNLIFHFIFRISKWAGKWYKEKSNTNKYILLIRKLLTD